MNRKLLTIGTGLLLGVLSTACSQETAPTPAAKADATPLNKTAAVAPTAAAKPVFASAAQPDVIDSPVPPKDARYTIYCAVIREQLPGDNIMRAKKLKDELIRTTGMPGWYVVHQARQSILYYGFYRVTNDPSDPRESARAKADHDKIEHLADTTGQRLFKLTSFMNLDAPDPEAPPEWNLMNAPGYWTIEIAGYKDSPERKQAAVDAVREARKQGIQAYYYHGDTVSSVCVGAWPAEAIKQQDSADAHSADPSQPLLVLPGGLNIKDQQLRGLHDSQGNRIKVMQDKIEVVDPTINDMMKRFPFHSVNGLQDVIKRKNPKTGAEEQYTVPCALVPFGDTKLKLTGITDTGTPSSLIAPTPQKHDPKSGEGQLRGIGG